MRVVVEVVVSRHMAAGGEGPASSPPIDKKTAVGLSIMRHKGRVSTRSISDIIFVSFEIIFGEVRNPGKPHGEV